MSLSLQEQYDKIYKYCYFKVIVSRDRQNMKNKGKISLIVILNMHMTVRFRLLVIFSAIGAIVNCKEHCVPCSMQ